MGGLPILRYYLILGFSRAFWFREKFDNIAFPFKLVFELQIKKRRSGSSLYLNQHVSRPKRLSSGLDLSLNLFWK